MTRFAPRHAPLLSAAVLLAACSSGSTGEQKGATGQVATADPLDEPVAEPAADPTHTERTDEAVEGSASATPAPPMESKLAQIPARFVGTWAPDERACAGNTDYQPTFQRVFIERDRVGFFETSGEVVAVAEAGGSTRVTVRERVGDATPVYPIMISLAEGGQALNTIRDGERRRLVKCSGSIDR